MRGNTKNITPVVDEARLVEGLQNGDIESFDTLFGLYGIRLYRFAYGFLKSKEESEEIVQDVFVKIWEKRTFLKPELQFKSYLFTIAYNMIRKHFRTKALLDKYLTATANIDDDNIFYTPDVDIFSLQKLVTGLVESMPIKRRMVFQKSRGEGKSIKEIAQEMGIAESTVENHLNQALKYLRNHLGNEYLAGLLLIFLFM